MSAAGQLPEDEVLERIKKLLNLAAKNPNENEAASAAAKAQELLARYNLDAATVENSAAVKDGKREEAKVDGGFYSYQRELWDSVAKLNFCLYWTQDYRVFTRSKRVGTGRDRYTTEGHVNKKRHRLVGRIVNTRATIALAQYLEEAIERVTLERLGERVNLGYVYSGSANAVRFSNWAVSFRKGCAARIIEQVEDRREQMRLKEAERARRDAARAKRAGVSTATALTLADHEQREKEANDDFLHGEGWTAKRAAQRAEDARRRREAEEAHTRWAKANPEEARAKAEREAAEDRAYWSRRRGGRRSGNGPRDTTDKSAYWSGYDVAEKIKLDRQVDGGASHAPRIGRS